MISLQRHWVTVMLSIYAQFSCHMQIYSCSWEPSDFDARLENVWKMIVCCLIKTARCVLLVLQYLQLVGWHDIVCQIIKYLVLQSAGPAQVIKCLPKCPRTLQQRAGRVCVNRLSNCCCLETHQLMFLHDCWGCSQMHVFPKCFEKKMIGINGSRKCFLHHSIVLTLNGRGNAKRGTTQPGIVRSWASARLWIQNPAWTQKI